MNKDVLPVTLERFNSPNFAKEKAQREKEGYVFMPYPPGAAIGAGHSSEGAKHPTVTPMAGYFKKKEG